MRPTAWLRPAPNGRPTHPWWWVTAGFAAIVGLIGIQFADAPGLLERGDSWWHPVIAVPLLCVLLIAWWQVGPAWRHPGLTAAIWAAPMMFALPMYSRDAYAYAAQGWMVARGLDPYTTLLGDAGQPGLLVGIHWIETTSVYPAVSLDMFGLAAGLTGSHLYWTTVALRLPSVVALVALAWLLKRLAARFSLDTGLVLWAGLLNPIMLMQWVGGAHNEALMVTLAVAAILASTDRGWRGWRGLVVAGVLLGLAMGIKQSAAFYGPGVVAIAWAARFRDWGAGPRAHPGGHGRGIAAGWGRLAALAVLTGGITVAVFAVSSLRFGLGWNSDTAGNPVGAMSNAPLSWLGELLRYPLADDVANSIVSVISWALIVAGIVAVWVWLGPRGDDPRRPWAFALATLAVVNVLGPAMQPWYLTMLLPLYVFWRAGARWDRAWLAIVIAFTLLPALQTMMAPVVAMPLVALPLWWFWRRAAKTGVTPLPPRASVI